MYPTIEGKGGFFFVEELVKELVNQGHLCVVISPMNVASKIGLKKTYGPRFEKKTINKLSTYDVYRPIYYGRNFRINGVSWARYECRKSIERTLKKISISFDVFYCHFFESGALIYSYAKKNKIPIIIASGESQIPMINKSSANFYLEDFREYISGVICVSTKNKEEAVNLGYTDSEKCIIIPNGVDLKVFHPMDKFSCRKKLGFKDSDFIITCIGNFSERKGQNRLIEAVDRIGNPNIKIILGGIGEMKSKSNSIIYSGFIAHDQIPIYLSASDIYVIPTRWEGCCNSIIEAMACGLAIISSNKKFNWDILNDKNSILIDPDNISEISEAINKLYYDINLKNKLKKNAYITSQELSIEKRTKRIIQFISNRIQHF